MQKRIISGISSILLLFAITTFSAHALYQQPSSTISGGGGAAASTGYQLTSTIGQGSATGLSTEPDYLHKGGFWSLGIVDTDAPALNFLLPGAYSRLNVPVNTLIASDIGSSVTGFYLSTSSTPPDPFATTGWLGTGPTAVIAPGEGQTTFYLWARDEAGNFSLATATTNITLIRWLLSTAIAGSGATSITSSPAGIICLNGNTGTCSANFIDGTTVTLTPAHAWNAHVVNWSPSCGSGDCAVLMNGNKSATATFAINTNVRLNSATLYSKIMDAYNVISGTGSNTIQAQTFSFPETLIFDNPGIVLLQGGSDNAFNPSTGYTTVDKLLLRRGTTKVRNVVIR